MSKKVLIYAYFSNNLGDDLFIKLLCERYPDTRFFMYSPRKYKTVFKNIKNLRIISNDLLFIRVINYLLRICGKKKSIFESIVANHCDAIVNIGGSLFIESKNWKEKYEYRKRMLVKNKDFFLLGANFGPYTDNEYYIRHKEHFKMYSDICFRDRHSYKLFSELPNVRMANDIVFQLDKKNIKRENKNNAVISVIKPSFRSSLSAFDSIYYKKISEIIIFLQEEGVDVTLMSFCEKEGDQEAIEEIVNILPKKNSELVRKHYYKYNIKETIDIIANSCYVVATRFHSMILGWLFNKPVLPIVYNEKMTNVLKDIDFKGHYVNIKRINSLDQKLVIKSMNENLIDINRQIKDSEKQFEKLDQYLGESGNT